MPTLGVLRAKYAILAEKFGLRPWELQKLTPRQIYEIYFHPRDKDGFVILPTVQRQSSGSRNSRNGKGDSDENKTIEQKRDEAIIFLNQLVGCGAITRPAFEKARRELDEKYPAQRPANPESK